MRVGLYDCDLDKKGANGLSIDLLKLARYYRGKNDIYSLIPNLTNLDLYTKIHYWSDLNFHYLPPELMKDNFEVGGKVFGLKIPKEIEDVKYNNELYRSWFEKYGDTGTVSKKRIAGLLGSTHLRLQRDNDILNYSSHIDLSNRTIIIHDENIFSIQNWQDILDDIQSNKKFSFGFRYPVVINNIKEKEQLDQYPCSGGYCRKFFNLNSKKGDFLFFVDNYDSYFSYARNVFVLPSQSFKTNHEKIQYVKKILSRVIFCQSRVKRFFLTIEDNPFLGDELECFFKYLSSWHRYNYAESQKTKNYRPITIMNYLAHNTITDWQQINHVFELDPEIKKLCLLNPGKKLSEEILYESN